MTLVNSYKYINKIILVAALILPSCIVLHGQDKVFRNESDLTTALIGAKTDAERTELLKINEATVTSEMGQTILGKAIKLADETKYEEAAIYASVYSQIVAEYGTESDLATALYILANIYLYQNNNETAIIYLDKSARLAEEVGDKKLMMNVLYRSALIKRSTGNYEQAFADAEKCLKLSLELGDKNNAGKAQLELGAASYLLGDYARSLKFYEHSRATFQEIDFKSGVQTVFDAIGTVYGTQGNYAQAADYFKRSITLAESINNNEGIALSTNNLGVIYFFQGNYQGALENYQRSLKIAEDIGDKNTIALNFNNLGITHFARGDNEKSLEYSKKSLALAEQIGDKERISESLNNIAKTLNKTGNLAEAVTTVERAIVIAQQIKQLDRLSEAYVTAGKIYLSLKRFNNAKNHFDQAITILERLRSRIAVEEQSKSLFLSDKVTPYHRMIDLLQREGRVSEAFGYAEKAKGRVLLDVLQGTKSQIMKLMTGAEKEKGRRLKKAVSNITVEMLAEENKEKPDQKLLVELNQQLQKARQKEEDFLTRTYAAHPELERRDAVANTITLDRTNDLLKNQSAVALEYVWAEDYVGLFVITANDKSQRPMVKYFRFEISPKDLAKLIEDFVKAVRERRANFDVLGRKLYEILVAPAAGEIAEKKVLCVIPDGSIWKVPFQALQNGDRYLLENHTVFSAPSLSVLDAAQKLAVRPIKPAGEVLAFANPSFSAKVESRREDAGHVNERGKKLTPLPEAEKEGRAIVRMYKGKSRLYMRAGARESRFKSEASDYKILHFATHGFLDDVSPMYSYLVLATNSANQDEDGLLTANEIMSLDLNADTAILSACETALGEYRAGEGVIGMTWAFLAAGVPTIVSSQWSVETVSTTQMMTEYHRALKNSRSSFGLEKGALKAEDLRQAQLKLLKNEKYSLPYYWAAFNVIGSAN